jgi:lysophospholipase L1-like esterase
MQGDPTTSQIAVANQAAGGNRMLADGLGPNVLARIDRDLLSQSGVSYAMIFEGVNDIGVAMPDDTNQTQIYDRLISAYEQIITRVHAHNLPIFGATITPFTGNDLYSHPRREETRQQVNEWIRSSGRFDAVIDFDQILADPNQPDQLNPLYDSGDYLHPNPEGYQAIADAFPLQIFAEFAEGVAGFV